jgi:hypothetical protein
MTCNIFFRILSLTYLTLPNLCNLTMTCNIFFQDSQSHHGATTVAYVLVPQAEAQATDLSRRKVWLR